MSSLRPLGFDQLCERFGKLLGVGDGCRIKVEAYVRAKAATRPRAPSRLALKPNDVEKRPSGRRHGDN